MLNIHRCHTIVKLNYYKSNNRKSSVYTFLVKRGLNFELWTFLVVVSHQSTPFFLLGWIQNSPSVVRDLWGGGAGERPCYLENDFSKAYRIGWGKREYCSTRYHTVHCQLLEDIKLLSNDCPVPCIVGLCLSWKRINLFFKKDREMSYSVDNFI